MKITEKLTHIVTQKNYFVFVSIALLIVAVFVSFKLYRSFIISKIVNRFFDYYKQYDPKMFEGTSEMEKLSFRVEIKTELTEKYKNYSTIQLHSVEKLLTPEFIHTIKTNSVKK